MAFSIPESNLQNSLLFQKIWQIILIQHHILGLQIRGELFAGLKKGGIKAIRFSPAVTAKFKKTVYDAAWAAVKKKAPKEGARLQKMLMK